jgi:transcriptional regulator with XRE-family HTH domain
MEHRRKQRYIDEMRDPDYRHAFADSMLNTVIAAQIKANRESRELSQEALGKLAGMKQSFVSAIEDVNYGSWTLSTLRKIARAFDLRLVVRFEGWNTLFDGIRTRGELDAFDKNLLVRKPFDEDASLTVPPAVVPQVASSSAHTTSQMKLSVAGAFLAVNRAGVASRSQTRGD